MLVIKKNPEWLIASSILYTNLQPTTDQYEVVCRSTPSHYHWLVRTGLSFNPLTLSLTSTNWFVVPPLTLPLTSTNWFVVSLSRHTTDQYERVQFSQLANVQHELVYDSTLLEYHWPVRAGLIVSASVLVHNFWACYWSVRTGLSFLSLSQISTKCIIISVLVTDQYELVYYFWACHRSVQNGLSFLCLSLISTNWFIISGLASGWYELVYRFIVLDCYWSVRTGLSYLGLPLFRLIVL